ncbi:hypothetical protein GJAV_G00253210 [Gymnothorax javanicus]|nr:hypothetical protein GJAV_G00253210 [Gymnothorax javanicus]
MGQIGQYFVREVVKGGAADRAGLEDDDIIIEVDGVNVEECQYSEVVEMIKASGNSLTLLVVEEKAYDYFKDQQIPITTLLLAQSSSDFPRTPRTLSEEEEKESKEAENDPAVLPNPTESRERTASTSSSSSSPSFDEQL